MNKQIEEIRRLIELNVFTCDGEEKVYGTKGAAEILYKKGYRKASDVASEIFAEIEACFGRSGALQETVGLVDFVKFSELKKKYTGKTECIECKYFVGCEEANWVRGCEDFKHLL